VDIKTISYAGSDIGRVRSSNQDSGYAGYNLFFVADGMGGHAGGDIASALCAQRIAQMDDIYSAPEMAKEALKDNIWSANGVLAETVKEHPELAGMGTTFSGLVFTGNQVTTGHVGDSRIYLARDGQVRQITKDHTFVQRLVDTGKITPEEALVHPRRSVLMRVLGDVEEYPEVDSDIFETKPGDRWMLCSDGLSGVVPEPILERLMLSKIEASEATELLIGEALEFGAPDNVTVVVVDVVPANLRTDFVPQPIFVGSSANEVVIDERKGGRILRVLNPMNFGELLRRGEDPTDYVPESDEYLEKILRETHRRIRWRRIRQLATIFIITVLAIIGLFAAYDYTQSRYYIGASSDGHVAIYKGIREALGPLKFSRLVEKTDVLVVDLPPFQQQAVERTISTDSLSNAEVMLQMITDTSPGKPLIPQGLGKK
jgi:serine/threonine protein phosphatase PrpC